MFVPLHLPMITQRHPFLALCLALVLASVVACSNNGEEMRRQLNELQARNQADSLMTDDSLALTLCDYFDSHGTSNEQMLAHYLLGRTYADMGEAPMALSEYHKAIDKADTANSNCDYALLCRVYSQMASIFFMQNLMEEYLDKLNESIFFAEKANDTIAAINSLGHKMLAYDRLQMPDSVAYLCDRVYETLCSIGQHQLAAQFSGFGINSFLKLRQVDKAKFYLQQYEIDSGYFDNINDVEIGREAYYNLKGRYYMLTLQYDSAEYFFRKELQYGHDLDNQNMASRDLSLLYQKKHIPDSAAKYALYSYEMNDSAYNQMTTDIIERLQSMYIYSHHQEKARLATEEAVREKTKSRILVYIIIGIVILCSFLLYVYHNKKKLERKKYLEQLNALEKAQTELQKLRTNEIELGQIIEEKVNEVENLRTSLFKDKQEKERTLEESELQLKKSETYEFLQKKAVVGHELTEEEWSKINMMVIEIFPRFYNFITSKQYALSINEYRACLLFRLHIKPVTISFMLGVSPSAVTKISKNLLSLLFNSEGVAKDLVEKLTKI